MHVNIDSDTTNISGVVFQSVVILVVAELIGLCDVYDALGGMASGILPRHEVDHRADATEKDSVQDPERDADAPFADTCALNEFFLDFFKV